MTRKVSIDLRVTNKFYYVGEFETQSIMRIDSFQWKLRASLVAQLVKNPPAKKKKKNPTCSIGRPGFDPWVGKIPGRSEQLPTPAFWPGEFMDRIVHGVAKSWTGLSDSLHFTESSYSSVVTSHTCRLSPALRAGLFCRSSFLWHAVMWDGLMLSKQLSKKMSDGGSSTHNLILNLNYKNFNFF